MKKIHLVSLLLSLTLSLSLPAQTSPSANTIPLINWHFEYQGGYYQAQVPGCIHTDLLSNHLLGPITDPFWGTNEDSLQWISHRQWTYSTTLSSKMLKPLLKQSDHLFLVFEGLQTHATIFIDSQQVATTNNMFRQWRIPIPSSMLKRGKEHLLQVRFSPTYVYDKEAHYQWSSSLKTGTSPLDPTTWLGHPDTRAFSRTAPYQQGWDWGPKLNSCGIWKPVYLTADTVPLQLPAPSAKPKVRYQLHTQYDSIGQRFVFFDTKLNQELFIRGANWIPTNTFPSLTPEVRQMYRRELCAAKDAHFNMIRIWGGGIYEDDYFFTLCDSLGLLVWVDFVYAGSLYPTDPDYLDNIRIEAEEQVQRLSKHPCVVLWCGNNEVKNGWEDWGWSQQYGYTEQQRKRISSDLQTIFGFGGILDQAVHKYLPDDFPYWPSSPLYGWGHKECDTHGDSHYWGVWWGELPFEIYREHTGRFMSEYGFQSYPQMSTIETFCPESERLIGSPSMNNHQKHGRGVQVIDKAMQTYYGTSSSQLSLDDFVYYSQLLQSYGMGMGVEAHLMRMGHCMGTLYWQLNDSWPVASWSSLDWYGNWKAFHYNVRDLFADTTIVVEPLITGPRPLEGTAEYGTFYHYYSPNAVHIRVIGNPTATVSCKVVDMQGREVLSQQLSTTDGHATFTLPSQYDTCSHLLLLQTPGAPQKLYSMVRPLHQQLSGQSQVIVTRRSDNLFVVSNPSSYIAMDIQLTAWNADTRCHGNFSDNYFHLLPGEQRTIRFLGEPQQDLRVTARWRK